MNKAVARNGTAEVCINLVLKLGPVPLEVGTIQIRPRLHVQYDAGDAAVDRDEDPCRPEKWNRQERDEQTNRPLCECSHRPAPHIGSIAAVWVRMTAEPRSGVQVASEMVHIAVSVDGPIMPHPLACRREGSQGASGRHGGRVSSSVHHPLLRYEACGSPIVWCGRILAIAPLGELHALHATVELSFEILRDRRRI